MDSCNSGSIQSSSCGDEEYDSRAESNISAFFNNNNPSQSQSHPPPPRSHLNPQPQPSPPQHHHHMFDPLSNYLDSIQKSPTHPNPNPFLNLDMVWSKPTRSEPNPADLGGLMAPCSSPQQNQAFLFSQLAGQTRNVASVSTTHQYSLPPPESASRDQSLSNNNSNSNNNNNNTTNMVRNPKKRSRASRRAPTTVLTTDTTNFRAMVQEFTGIPAPPFTSSPFPRTRLDLFGSAAIRSASSTHLDPPLPPYLLRPFAQKLQPPQSHSFSASPSSFPPSSSMVENLASNNSTNNNPSTNSASPSINYHLSSSSADHLGLLIKQQQQPLNMHNQILGFQSISQAPPKYTLGNCSKTQQPSLEISPSVDSHLKMGVLEELGLSHAHVNNNNNNIGVLHQNMVPASSEHGSGNNHNNNVHNSSADWAHRKGTVTDNDGDHDGGFLGSLNGIANYRSDISERVSNGKVVNYSASPSEFRVEKGPECGVAARGEGTVESWINCSSD